MLESNTLKERCFFAKKTFLLLESKKGVKTSIYKQTSCK